ncbi:hypothetical protein BDZ45DRAFT_745482 [Acephala macrosclerotiorum]|nr:hypothetical protein BDZ45DRAFT_745482 [Acephala macrosclerotiorum]
MSLILFVCVQFLQPAISAPVPAPDQQKEYVSWNRGPQTRGTFSLLSSCLITLSLSVWTAVHLNITVERLPHEKLSFFRRLNSQPAIRRLKWMLMGLLAPELVVYTAWQQWSSAREMTRKMQQLLKKQAEEDGNTTTGYEWTMVHSFYAGMGGFVIDISGSSFSRISTSKPELKSYIPGDCCQFTLTAQGVLFLVSDGYRLPFISKKSILDRSKADGIAKTLVCLQAGYMIVQCATRVASKLPISLLEVNTLGHVLCALVMYSFWLNKPQDIHTPTHISDETIRPTCADMYMGSSMSRSSRGYLREFYGLEWRTTPHSEEIVRESNGSNLPPGQLVLLPPLEAPAGTVITVRENETLKDTALGPILSIKHRITKEEQKEVGYQYASRVQDLPYAYRPAAVHLDECGITRWQLAASFIRVDPPKFNRRDLLATTYGDPQFQHFVREVPNWPKHAGYLSESIYTSWAAIALAAGLYGGLHVSARNSHFPSFIEKVMWCASSILIAGSGAITLIYILIDRLPTHGGESFLFQLWGELHTITRENSWERIFDILDDIHDFISLYGVCILGLAYIFARMFIVVEAFISLRDLPIGVYQTPNWTQSIPHL